MSAGTGQGALFRLARRGRPAPSRPGAQRCGLCGADVRENHRHLLAERDDTLACACQACALLFEPDRAGGHHLLVPDRRVALPGLAGALGVPVGLAFFVVQADGRVVAHYPSPIGVTQGEADPAQWAQAVARCEPLAMLRPRVEALLVNTARGADEHWIAPIDDCYRLVGLVRAHWRGMSGGDTVWPAVEEFFAGLRGAPGSPVPRDAGRAPRRAYPEVHENRPPAGRSAAVGS